MFEQFQKHLIGKVEKALTEIVVEFADGVDEKTPEDTYELISRNQTEMPHMEGDSMKARVFNDDPKAPYVEYGHEPKEYSYYKGSGRRKGGSPFYRGVGAKMFKRTLEEQRESIHNLLQNL